MFAALRTLLSLTKQQRIREAAFLDYHQRKHDRLKQFERRFDFSRRQYFIERFQTLSKEH